MANAAGFDDKEWKNMKRMSCLIRRKYIVLLSVCGICIGLSACSGQDNTGANISSMNISHEIDESIENSTELYTDNTDENNTGLNIDSVDISYDIKKYIENSTDRLILDEEEQNSYSTYVKLGEPLSFDDYSDYERYLVFQNKEWVRYIYSYESDAPNISIEQAMMLCAELLKERNPGMVIEEVMAEDKWGYVGYKFNRRIMGEQIIENKIGTQGVTSFDGMRLMVYMYEDIIDDMETGEGHTATTATFHLFLKDKILIEE